MCGNLSVKKVGGALLWGTSDRYSQSARTRLRRPQAELRTSDLGPMPQAGVRTYETPSRSSNSDWADKIKITILRDRNMEPNRLVLMPRPHFFWVARKLAPTKVGTRHQNRPFQNNCVTGRMRSDRSSSVRRLAGCNYGGNGGPVNLNYGSSGGRTDYLQTWLQGADVRADARAALQFEKQVFRLLQ